MRLQASVEIRATPALVFQLITTPERLPEWNTSAERAWRVGAGETNLGARAAFVGRVLGQPVESETEVVAFDPPRLFVTRAIRGPRLETVFRLEPFAFGTRVDMDVSGQVPGGALGGFVAERLLRAELERSLGRLRELCEQAARAAAAAEPPTGGAPVCWVDLPLDLDPRARAAGSAESDTPPSA